MFEYFELIVFHLVERIALNEFMGDNRMYQRVAFPAFSYSAIPSRHEAPEKPYLREEEPAWLCRFENIIHETPKKSKLSCIVDMAKTIHDNQLSSAVFGWSLCRRYIGI